MKNKVHIGCSSFYNPYWQKIFYPEDMPRAQWFEYYCTYFDTYEINATFYKFPTIKVMENWYKKTPEKFLFAVKVPKEITHIKKMIDCEKLIADFYAVSQAGLKHKLGCILFQFPPSYQYTPDKLQEIINKLDGSYKNVTEFRHPSWWVPEVWNALFQNNIIFCSVSHPTLPKTILTEFPILYLRLHGDSQLFYSNYSSEELMEIKDCITTNKKIKNSFIYFNNTASSAGILNALDMKNLF